MSKTQHTISDKIKSRLRTTHNLLRKAMSQAEWAERSRHIMHRLWCLSEIRDAPAVLIYAASKDGELDTHILFDMLRKHDVRVLVPLMRPGKMLAWSELTSWSTLVPVQFGILEPTSTALRIIDPPQYAPVVVPGVAFSPEGARVGYGGGYYDRFLASHSGIRIAPAFHHQIEHTIPCEAHDAVMDIVVTESCLYRRA